jgi:hypothetical protein
MGFESDKSVAAELAQFTENKVELSHQILEPAIRNLATKKAQGKYDREKAIKAFLPAAEKGARLYAATFGNHESQWSAMFPLSIRKLVATHWRNSFEEEYDLGNYSHMAPKKYQKVFHSKRVGAKKKYTWTKAGTQEERNILGRDLLKGSSREEDPNLWEDLKMVATMLKTGSPVSAILDMAQSCLPPDAVLLLKTRTHNL